MAIYPSISIIATIFSSHIVDYGYPGTIDPLVFLGEYWLRYANLYFTSLRFGVLVITK